MMAGVADTHTILWYLLDNPKLSAAARQFMERAAAAGDDIAVSTISLAEIVYLVEKGWLPKQVYSAVRAALSDPTNVLKEAPLSVEIVDVLHRVSRDEVPDMPDRIIAATAVYFGVPVISRDNRISLSNVRSVW